MNIQVEALKRFLPLGDIALPWGISVARARARVEAARGEEAVLSWDDEVVALAATDLLGIEGEVTLGFREGRLHHASAYIGSEMNLPIGFGEDLGEPVSCSDDAGLLSRSWTLGSIQVYFGYEVPSNEMAQDQSMRVTLTVGYTSHGGPGEEAEPQDELLEVLDEAGQVLQLRTRRDIHQDPTLRHRAVHVLVRNSHGEVFLQRRSMNKVIQPGRWDTSVGGHVDPWEGYEEAARREMNEELGVDLREEHVTGELELFDDYIWQTEQETELVRSFSFTWDGEIRCNPVEIDDGRFWTEAELQEAAGTGLLTANLEKELRLRGVLL